MKVLYHGKRNSYHIWCTCKSLLEVDYEDVRTVHEYNKHGMIERNYIYCPVCGTTIDLCGDLDKYFPWIEDKENEKNKTTCGPKTL